MSEKSLKELNSILKNFGIDPLTRIDEFEKLEKTDKNSILSKPHGNFLELRITSGSTGKPLNIYYSKKCVEAFIRRAVTSLEKADATKKDIALNLFAYGNFVAGSMYERACLKSGVPIASFGAPNTFSVERVLDLVPRLKPTVWFSVPSYALMLIKKIKEQNMDCLPEKIVCAGEKLVPSYMKEFRSENIHVYNQYGLTECPAVAYADRDQGDILNVIEDGLIAEAAPFDDKTSELVITDLNNTSMPIIRYNTHDQIIILEKNGIFVKKFKLVGRTDDLTKIRGKLVPKNDLREVILAYTQEFYIEIVIENDSDCLLVHLPKELKEMESKIQEDFKNKFKLRVNLVFEEKVNPPRTVSNKMIYIVDRRK